MNNYYPRPEHDPIKDVREYLKPQQRMLSLVTFRTTLRTSLMIFDAAPYGPRPGDSPALTIELDRAGRNKLIAELTAANDFEMSMLNGTETWKK